MKRILLFFFVFVLSIQLFSQDNLKWIADLDTLKVHLLREQHLFKSFSKQNFIDEIENLKQQYSNDIETNYWQLTSILAKFNNPNITIKNIYFKRFPFEIKEFNNQFYITSIKDDYSEFLGSKLQSINSFTIKRILKSAKKSENINIKTFLEFYKFSNSDTLQLNVLDNNNNLHTIKLVFDTLYDFDEMAKIIPKKTPFYLNKKQRWFWQYGINYGTQVYFKYNIGLSKEFLNQQMDSLNISEKILAIKYHLPLQSIYDAPKFDDFTEKLFHKFKKRRYKKLFIDLRNNKIGNILAFTNFIKKIKKLKRINTKNRLYVFVDKSVASSAIETILKLKSDTKVTIIGEEISNIACSTDKINSLYLPNLEFKIYYPTKKCKLVTIKPDIKVSYSFLQYINGIDPILQKALN